MGRKMAWQLEMFKKTLKKKMKLELLNKHLGDTRGRRCLMITCGDNNGAMNYHLRSAGGDWTWAEFEEGGIREIEDLLNEPVVKLNKDECKMPFPDGSFDCIVVIDCHEHLEDPAPFTQELARITKLGGKVVVSVPNGDEGMLGVRIKNLLGMTKEKYGHIVTGYDIPDMKRLLENAGLNCVGSGSYSKLVTEMLELAINLAYVKVLAKRSKAKVEEGTIAPSSRAQLESVKKSYRLYALIYPLFLTISKLDWLLHFTKGYAVIVEARR